LVLALNGGARAVTFDLPTMGGPGRWVLLVDTAHDGERAMRKDQVPVGAHGLVLLRFERDG
jgi:hypothetical protein